MAKAAAALFALLLGGWLATIPIAWRHGTDEPYPLTAFPMYTQRGSTPGSVTYYTILVEADGANRTLPAEEVFHPERDLPWAQRALANLHDSVRHGCPRLQVDGYGRCDGSEAMATLPPDLVAAWSAASQARLGLDAPPERIWVAREVARTPADLSGPFPLRIEPLFGVQVADGAVVHP